MTVRALTVRFVVAFVAALTLPLSAALVAGGAPPAPTLTGLIISGPTSVSVGQTAQYTAKATYSDGSSQTLSGSSVWWYTYESTATIDHATGILTGVAVGTANVRFDYAQNGVIIASTPYPITVVASATRTLTGLIVNGPISVSVGQTAQYTAKATYSDGSSQTLSGSSIWWYTYESTATIDHATGILTGVAAGTANVRFDYAQNGVIIASTPYPITVVASATRTLTGLIVNGPTSVNVGQTAQYTAKATYSDGSSQTLSGSSVWWYVYESTATIDHATGILTGVAAGGANVRFDYAHDGVITGSTPYPISVVGSGGTTGYGPQSTIYCPAGAIDIWPGTSIQTMVNTYAGGTAFCLRSGVHYLTSSITPKTGDTFVGEYGAVLDGSGWTTSDPSYTQAAFRAHNQDIDYVTIRNLVIRNMPQRGIHTYYMYSDHWTIEYNEIVNNRDIGIHFSPNFVIRNNYIHHNAYSGFMGYAADNSVVENNEIAYNGREQKVAESANVAVRNNFVHHNAGTGIWFDSNNTGAVIEGNRIEDNAMMGIYYEISSDAIIRNNTVKRSQQAGVMLSVSKNVQIYNNVLEGNFRGILYFLNCPSLGTGPYDLTNNTAHDNTITVGTQSGAWANALTYNACTSTQLAPYLNGSKNLTFSHNTYRVPFLNAWYWVWGDAAEYWNQWLALPQDATSTVSQY